MTPVRAQREPRSARGDVLELIARTPSKRQSAPSLVVGSLKSLDDDGQPRVDFAANPTRKSIVARSIVQLGSPDIGRAVALMFEESDPRRPIVIGLIQHERGRVQPDGTPDRSVPSRDVEIDGERLVFTAQKEIVLRCGKATIILTRAGKVLLRGAYVLSRSSGVNRLKGGSVQIN